MEQLIEELLSSERAVLVTDYGNIKEYNAAAVKLFGELKDVCAYELFHHDFFIHNAKHFAGFMDIDDCRYTVHVYTNGEKRVFVLIKPTADPLAVSKDMLRSIGIYLSDMMSTLTFSSEYFLEKFEYINDPEGKMHSRLTSHFMYKMLRLINNINTICDESRGQYKKPEYFDIVWMIVALTSSLDYAYNINNVKITCTYDRDELYYYGNLREIEQVVLNLVSNSCKYCSSGGHVNIDLKTEYDFIQITVTDDGCGIRPDVFPDIWNRHCYCIKHSDRPDILGLGLRIVGDTVKIHGGSAFIESEPGNGTTITVRLPAQHPNGIVFHHPSTEYGAEGMHIILRELADVLTEEQYDIKYLD